MRRRVFRIVALALALLLVAFVGLRYGRRLFGAAAPGAVAEDATNGGAATTSATPKVYVGVYLRDVTRLEPKDATFDVDADIWAKWRGAFDTDELRVTNAAADASLEKIHESADGDWHVVSWRLRGPLRATFPLRDYPFDRQKIAIRFELATRSGAIEPDLAASSIAERFSVTGWDYTPRFTLRMGEKRYPSDLGRLENEGKPTTVRAIAYELPVQRPSVMAALKLFLPLTIILLVALVVFWVHPEELEARAGVGVTALLTCFAFQFSVADTLPQVSYLTLTDRFFLGTYAVSVVALAISVLVAHLARTEREDAAVRIDRFARVLFPLVVVAVGAIWIRGVEQAAPAEGSAVAAQPPAPVSARDTLRVTTTLSASLTAAPLPALVAGDLVLDRDGLDPLPLYVEEVPSVRTHGLELLPDGGMEMTWRLREGMRWSDDAPLVASDVCYGENLVKPPHLVSCTTRGERVAVLRFDERVTTALDSPTVWPEHVLSKLGLADYDAVRDYKKTHAVPGLGPYRIASFVLGKSATLEPNPRYPGAAPAIAHVQLTFAPNPQSALDGVMRGEVDLAPPNTIKPDGLAALVAAKREGAFLRRGAVLIVLFPDYGVPLLGTLEGRRALSAAIDRAAIATTTYQGQARPIATTTIDGPLAPPADPSALAKLAKEHPDWAKARLPVYNDKGGGPPIAEAIVDQLQRAGFTGATIVTVDSLTATRRNKSHGGLVLMPVVGGKNGSPLATFNLPMAGSYYDRTARHVAYTDEAAELFGLMERSLYPERRDEVRLRLEKLHEKLLPSIPVVVADERMYVDPSLRDWDTEDFGAHLDRAWFAAK